MNRDKSVINTIMNNPNEEQTLKLAHYISSARFEVVGWAYAYLCLKADMGDDIREVNLSSMLQDFKRDIYGESNPR